MKRKIKTSTLYHLRLSTHSCMYMTILLLISIVEYLKKNQKNIQITLKNTNYSENVFKIMCLMCKCTWITWMIRKFHPYQSPTTSIMWPAQEWRWDQKWDRSTILWRDKNKVGPNDISPYAFRMHTFWLLENVLKY